MKINKLMAAAAALLMACTFASCEKDNDPSATTTHIYFSSPTGASSVFQNSDQGITLDLTLSAPASETTTFTLTATGDAAAAVSFEPETVTVAAGATSAQFTVTAGGAELTEAATAVITATGLDTDKFDVKETFTLTVYPPSTDYELTETEKALIEAFKQQHGVDLTPWLGYVDVKGTIEFPGGGSLDAFTEPTTIDIEGVTMFRLSPESTPANVMLDMVSNPMGMTEYMLSTFRNLTIDDREYFANDDEEDNEYNLSFMRALNWNSESIEEFVVTLPGMTLDVDASGKKADINFVVEGECFALDNQLNPLTDSEGEPILLNFSENRVNFDFYYTAWERQLNLFLKKDPVIFEQTCFGQFAHPAAYLGVSSVLTDDWGEDLDEEDGPNLYVAPKGVIDFEKGTMTFEFPFDCPDQTGYSRVKVVYTIAK